jgi:KUP system potassium uptake protein
VSKPEPSTGRSTAGVAALTLSAVGIVFGDIGTSPLYAMKETFAGPHELAPSEGAVYGVLSLIFWAITIVVTLKYVTLIMRADNDGEGGIMALIALVRSAGISSARARWVLVALGVFGASLFYGDGIITPAISVLSAVEGLEVVEPGMDDMVVPLTLAILTGLFLLQRFGTGVVGRAFGPVMITWFLTLAIFGIAGIADNLKILGALSPHHAVAFFVDQPGDAFLALGSVVLAITGAEALYADMGHFGPGPIRRGWFLAVLPALVLNYLGQGALVLDDPQAVSSPFFLLVPEWARLPMVFLAALAAVIASQAVISGAFSVTRQAVQLGFLPLLTVKHTSTKAEGQVYVPAVNWGLFAAIVGLVIGFGSSTALASAYGIAVTGTLAIDTVLFFVVVRKLWHKPLSLVLAGAIGFGFVDLMFFAANVPKIEHGGWFPLAVAAVVFTVLMTWRRGHEVVAENRAAEEGPLLDFVIEQNEREDPPVRVPGTAVFLNASARTTPLALRYNVEHNHVLHEHVVVCTVEMQSRPYVPDAERVEIDDLEIPDDGIAQVKVRFGFAESPDIPAALRTCGARGLHVDVDNATYFLSRVTIQPGPRHAMARWRKRLYLLMSRNAAGRAAYFRLPDDRVVSFGSAIEL